MVEKNFKAKTPQEWKRELSAEAYRVLRENGTEAPYSGTYDNHFKTGTYICAACKTPLFNSGNKYNSGCGWPAFDKAIAGAILYLEDLTHGMRRIETKCATCDSHLGHIFEDGPKETTGQRYCINSVCLEFIPEKTTK